MHRRLVIFADQPQLETMTSCEQVITDLLNPEATHLLIREDAKKGVFVERLSEHHVTSSAPLLPRGLLCYLVPPARGKLSPATSSAVHASSW